MNDKIISKVISCLLLGTLFTYTMPVLGYTKEETVYSKMDNSGKQYKTIVTAHLQNDKKEEVLNDVSDLLNIKNIGGEETFSQDGRTIIWNANGEDIYYQGESEKKLPVTLNITYTLDGEKIEAKDLAGKSGKLTIKMKYTNQDSHKAIINGKQTTLYTPFVVICGTVIENDKARNVEINSGKIIDDGTKTIIVGLSLPGMQESLDIPKNTLEIPSTITITMDVTDFELGNMMTYITPKVIEKKDMDFFDDLDEMYSQMHQLQTASKKLVSGSKQLREGSQTLNSGALALKTGITTAKKGAQTIEAEVAKSIKMLKNDKRDAVDSKTMAVIKKQAEQSALKTYENKKAGIAKQAEAEAKETVESMLKKPDSNSDVSKIVGKNATELITNLAKSGVTITPELQKMIVAQFTNTAGEVAMSTAQMTAASAATQTAKETMVATAEKTATDVAKQVGNTAKKTFTNQVVSQMMTLDEGLKELISGLAKIETGAKNLSTGTKELNKGANTLSKGMKQLDKEGISTMCNYINGDVKDLTVRLEKLQDLAEEHRQFTMATKGTDGSSKFILMMDSIKKEEGQKQEAMIYNPSKEEQDNENK